MMDEARLQIIQKEIGYTFQDKAMLARALRHSSYVNEHDLTYLDCNERLEFLGDAILEVSVSWLLYSLYPDMAEGKLTQKRACLVCEKALAENARKLGLGMWLQLGKGEEKTGGREKDSILADAMEALIGAIFLDGGSGEADSFIKRVISFDLMNRELEHDCKTELQEHFQKNGTIDIRYDTKAVPDAGPDEIYKAAVYVKGQCLGVGKGRSKKAAQQDAASCALRTCREQSHDIV